MTVEEALCARVESLSPVVALAGSRIYVEKLPQSPTYPCARVLLVDDLSNYHLRGLDGIGRARVQVDAFAEESSGQDPYEDAALLAAAIDGDSAGDAATGLSGFIGSMGGSPSIEVLSCQRVDRRRQYDPDELRVVTMSQDYIVMYRRT